MAEKDSTNASAKGWLLFEHADGRRAETGDAAGDRAQYSFGPRVHALRAKKPVADSCIRAGDIVVVDPDAVAEDGQLVLVTARDRTRRLTRLSPEDRANGLVEKVVCIQFEGKGQFADEEAA